MARIIAWVSAIILLHALFAGGMLLMAGGAAFRYLFGRTFEAVAGSVLSIAATVGTFAILLDAATGGRLAVFSSYWNALGRLAKASAKGCVWLVRLFLFAVEGVPIRAEKKRKKEGTDAGQ